MNRLSDKLIDLAGKLSYAKESKDAARVRALCTRQEWELVLVEAKRIYRNRLRTNR